MSTEEKMLDTFYRHWVCHSRHDQPPSRDQNAADCVKRQHTYTHMQMIGVDDSLFDCVLLVTIHKLLHLGAQFVPWDELQSLLLEILGHQVFNFDDGQRIWGNGSTSVCLIVLTSGSPPTCIFGPSIE